MHQFDDPIERFAIEEAVGSRGWRLINVDLTEVSTKADLIERLASGFGFPDWHGHNWDAVADLVNDLSWAPATGYVVLVEGVDETNSDWRTARSILAEAVGTWGLEGVPFHVLVRAQLNGRRSDSWG